MHPLSAQLDKISTTLISIDVNDLQGLAEVHRQFDELHAAIEQVADLPADDRIETLTSGARSLVEQLILDEVEDAQRALQSVQKLVGEVRSLVSSGGLPDAAVPDDSVEAAMKALSDGTLATEPVASFPAPPPPPQVLAIEPPTSAAPDAPRHFAQDEHPLLLEFTGEANSHLETAEQELLALEDDPSSAESLGSLFRAFHTIKGVAGFLDLRQIQALAHVAENLLDRARSGQVTLTGTASQLVLNALDMMKTLVGAVHHAVKTDAPLAHTPGVDQLVRKLEAFLSNPVSDAPAAPERAVQSAPSAESAGAPEAAAPASEETARQMAETAVKVSTERLDKLIDMVGELVIANSMVVQDLGASTSANVRLTKHLAHLGKIVRELQDLSMSLRMVQVGNVFRKMTRVARDTARKALKQVELTLEGTDTELDRNVVDALSDPLMHMIRNAVDHGIEPVEERVAAGKTPHGNVTLRAAHKGGAIHIDIVDDGRGLPLDKILAKAQRAGLVREGEVLTENEICQLIFHAGLSTAEKVTDISGRGVGMDVVKRNIEQLRGRVEITTTRGRGSTFTIRLPLTLAVIDGLVTQVGGEKYIIPINSIEQSLRPTPDMLSTVQGRGEIVSVRGAILPLLRLHQLFHVTPRHTDPCESLVVIVQDNARRACLLVDELLGQEQVVIKALGEGIGNIKGISGGAVLGDGNVSLILDVPGLIESASK